MVRRRHDWHLHHYIHAQQLGGRPAMVLVFRMPHCRCTFLALPDNTTERWKHEAEIELWWLAGFPFYHCWQACARIYNESFVTLLTVPC